MQTRSASLILLLLLVPLVSQSKEKTVDPFVAGEDGVTRPKLLVKHFPRYPQAALKKEIEGQVVLRAVINTKGRVGHAEVLSSSPADQGFEDNALEVVDKWRYRPATKDGKPVDVYEDITIDFSLDRIRRDYALPKLELKDKIAIMNKVLPAGSTVAGLDKVSLPQKLKGKIPKYPSGDVRSLDPHATVNLLVQLSVRGTIEEVSYIYSTFPGYGFEESAMETVVNWRFKPAEKNGQPVNAYYWLNVDFKSRGLKPQKIIFRP